MITRVAGILSIRSLWSCSKGRNHRWDIFHLSRKCPDCSTAAARPGRLSVISHAANTGVYIISTFLLFHELHELSLSFPFSSQTQYLTLPKSPSPVNLPVHYTPAISASPLRQVDLTVTTHLCLTSHLSPTCLPPNYSTVQWQRSSPHKFHPQIFFSFFLHTDIF